MAVRTEKLAKVPNDLIHAPYHHGILQMNGINVVESCSHADTLRGSMYLEDHMLLFVLEGNYTVRFGAEEHVIHKNEMVLLQKAIVVDYEKSGEPAAGNLLDYMMFFLKDELLAAFIQMADLKSSRPAALVPISVNAVNDRLISFIESLKPYFKESDRIGDNLMKMKLLELLFDVADANE
ncbi:hypothetical protein [Paenibacillus sp. R14(2021)]|uniref:hypothetical protein n=1 Tax=Paenibacillus sp. R14(2021) TaxID=2859228 RepID=UPI001C61138D|nr:hypothetical protein [Paenibacillus sp. R14(2021)]